MWPLGKTRFPVKPPRRLLGTPQWGRSSEPQGLRFAPTHQWYGKRLASLPGLLCHHPVPSPCAGGCISQGQVHVALGIKVLCFSPASAIELLRCLFVLSHCLVHFLLPLMYQLSLFIRERSCFLVLVPGKLLSLFDAQCYWEMGCSWLLSVMLRILLLVY